jgi:predicted HicB family RNase H-like nuclease
MTHTLTEPIHRTAQLAVRVRPDEREVVQFAAAEAGISVGRLMRQALAHEIARLATEPKRAPVLA